jgi:hypothetical protein
MTIVETGFEILIDDNDFFESLNESDFNL